MLEFKKTTISFKDYNGGKHSFEVPPYSTLKAVQNKIEEKPEKVDEIIIDSLEEWGVKRDLLEELELQHIRKLWESVLFAKKD